MVTLLDRNPAQISIARNPTKILSDPIETIQIQLPSLTWVQDLGESLFINGIFYGNALQWNRFGQEKKTKSLRENPLRNPLCYVSSDFNRFLGEYYSRLG